MVERSIAQVELHIAQHTVQATLLIQHIKAVPRSKLAILLEHMPHKTVEQRLATS